jgi:predicted DNA-binding protein
VRSTTSSFRIPEDLRVRLAQSARRLKKPKNRIIVEALDEYLRKTSRETLAAEARRQSLLASASPGRDDEFWEKLADTRGWK